MASNIRVENNAPKVRQEMTNRKDLILTAIGEKARSLWVKYITDKGVVDTGRFRGSADYRKNGENEVIIGSNLQYSIFLELGTSKMAARPTLRPAILEHKDDFRKIAENLLKNG